MRERLRLMAKTLQSMLRPSRRLSVRKFILLLSTMFILVMLYIIFKPWYSRVHLKPSVLNYVSQLEKEDFRYEMETKMRRDVVKSIMQQVWANYTRYAIGANEYAPLSKKGKSSVGFMGNNLGAFVVDSFDTMFIMNLSSEVNQAKRWLRHNFKKENLYNNIHVGFSVFEMNIRFVGGFLSAYSLTSDSFFLQKAQLVADLLLPAFQTKNGIPAPIVYSDGKLEFPAWYPGPHCTLLSDMGSLHMEFSYLSELTGKSVYKDHVTNIRSKLKQFVTNLDGLYPLGISTDGDNHKCRVQYSLGSGGDSFYEYLIKEHMRSACPLSLNMYQTALNGINKHLLFQINSSKDDQWMCLGSSDASNNRECNMDHLSCFAGGMFALGAASGIRSDAVSSEQWLHIAIQVTETCHSFYSASSSGLSADTVIIQSNNGQKGQILPQNKAFRLRPEMAETYFYLWRLSGDKRYREWGWELIQNLQRECSVANGYSGLDDVTKHGSYDDTTPSYFPAETLKYLYLLFEDSIFPLSEWVFNTEGHAFPSSLDGRKSSASITLAEHLARKTLRLAL